MPVVILISVPQPGETGFIAANVHRFYSQERPYMTERLGFVRHTARQNRHRIAKIGSALQLALYNRISAQPSLLGTLACSKSKWPVYYQEACRYWAKATRGVPFFKRNGERMQPPHGRLIHFVSEQASSFAACLLNSSLFYWAYSAMCDCEHINDSFVRQFPIPADWERIDWRELSARLVQSLNATATRKLISTKQGHKIEYDEINAVNSRGIIDEIDAALGEVFRLSPPELDFVINYDRKYREGAESMQDGDDVLGAVSS
jgi:hypothetical protein